MMTDNIRIELQPVQNRTLTSSLHMPTQVDDDRQNQNRTPTSCLHRPTQVNNDNVKVELKPTKIY